jgi:sulfate transport system ATP-binding protein
LEALNPAPGEEERIIEAQISAQTFDQQGFKEGETLVVNPRKARVFVSDAQAA